MRFAITALLFCAAFGGVVLADTIDFSGSIDASELDHSIQLSGTDGFSLFSDVPEPFAQAPRGNCFSPCEVSLGFAVDAYGEPGYWSTGFEGTTLLSSLNDQAGTIGGSIQFTSVPFVPADCVGCAVSLPMTYSGEIFAKFGDGTDLYDLQVSGSGLITFNTAPTGSPGEFEFYGLRGNITGTAVLEGTAMGGGESSTPEPATVALMFAGAVMLLLRRVSNYAGTLSACLRSAK